MADKEKPKEENKGEEKAKKKKERPKFKPGHLIKSETNTYKIDSILGSGGFGDVYKVHPSNRPGKHYAMKTEYFDKKKRKLLNRLKVEMAVFGDIQSCKTGIDKTHFVNMIDKGKTEFYKFIVMEIVSYSLIDIRNTMQKGFTSSSTIIQIGRQTMQAIEALHNIGYVHRDIKPHNFAIGRPPNDNKIFMLDFGIARRFLDTERRVRIPRKNVKYLGTVKYAARACHQEKEQCRRDDIEVWFYMMLEYFNKENIRWRRLTDKDAIVRCKNETFQKNKTLNLLIPEKFFRLFGMIDALSYTCAPDYAAIHKILDDICKDENIDESLPLDWIGKEMEPNKKKKKKRADERLLNEEDTEQRLDYEAKMKRRQVECEKRKKMEDDLVKLYKEVDDRPIEQIRAEIRSKLRKTREEERQKKRAAKEERRDEEGEGEDDEESEEDYSDESYEPRRRSKMSVLKPVKDEPSKQKIENRKKKTAKRSREDPDDENNERRPSGNRKKASRHTQDRGGSRMEKIDVRKRQSRMEKPPEKPPDSPPLKSVSVKMRTVNDYIVFTKANDMEKAADAKDKEEAERKAREKFEQLNAFEVTGKGTEAAPKESPDKKGK